MLPGRAYDERISRFSVMRLLTKAICLLVTSAQLSAAQAGELKVFASRAIWTVLTAIGPDFERSSGHKLNTTTGLSGDFARRINSGEAFDVLAAPTGSLVGLTKEGKLRPDSQTEIARSKYGVVIRAGAAKPDVSSVDKFKDALMNATSVTYLPVPGVPQLIERLGLKTAIQAKTTVPTEDVSADLVAQGEVELGIMAATQAITTPGLELVGLLPAEIEISTDFGGAIGASASNPEGGRSLLLFLKSPLAKETIKAQGMEPF
jgi:molybdate transport system substrate-binding protein